MLLWRWRENMSGKLRAVFYFEKYWKPARKKSYIKTCHYCWLFIAPFSLGMLHWCSCVQALEEDGATSWDKEVYLHVCGQTPIFLCGCGILITETCVVQIKGVCCTDEVTFSSGSWAPHPLPGRTGTSHTCNTRTHCCQVSPSVRLWASRGVAFRVRLEVHWERKVRGGGCRVPDCAAPG